MVLILRKPDLAGHPRTLTGSRRKVQAVAAPPSGGEVEVAAPMGIELSAADAAPVPPADVQAAAQYEIEAAHTQGFEQGREAGLQAGETEGRAAYAAGLRQLESIAQSLTDNAQASIEAAETVMVEIVFTAVCKILGQALVSADGARAAVRHALSQVGSRPGMHIRLNPSDLELIEEGGAFGVAGEAQWIADPELPVGGCCIESGQGTLDALIDTQLLEFKQLLLAERQRAIVAGGGA